MLMMKTINIDNYELPVPESGRFRVLKYQDSPNQWFFNVSNDLPTKRIKDNMPIDLVEVISATAIQWFEDKYDTFTDDTPMSDINKLWDDQADWESWRRERKERENEN